MELVLRCFMFIELFHIVVGLVLTPVHLELWFSQFFCCFQKDILKFFPSTAKYNPKF